jgi:hypothetical protein
MVKKVGVVSDLVKTSESELSLAIWKYAIENNASKNYWVTRDEIKACLERKGFVEFTPADLEIYRSAPAWHTTLNGIWAHKKNKDNFFKRGCFYGFDEELGGWFIDPDVAPAKVKPFKINGGRRPDRTPAKTLDEWITTQFQTYELVLLTDLIFSAEEEGFKNERLVKEALRARKDLEKVGRGKKTMYRKIREAKEVRKQPAYVQNDQLMCSVSSIQYDFTKKSGSLFMQQDNCCDAPGCINMFLDIDPNVSRIETFQGGTLDTVYRKVGSEWVSGLPMRLLGR